MPNFRDGGDVASIFPYLSTSFVVYIKEYDNKIGSVPTSQRIFLFFLKNVFVGLHNK